MSVDQERPWQRTLARALLCVLLAMAFAISVTGGRESQIEYAKHDGVSDGGHENPTSWFGRGGPRIVKRLVGVDHLAVNAVVPDELAIAPVLRSEPGPDQPIPRRSSARPHGTSGRGPPAAITIL